MSATRVKNVDTSSLMFEHLKLIDKPSNSQNTGNLTQTLAGCFGCLERWPLRPPNVNTEIPSTISDMVNILTDAEAAAAFLTAEAELEQNVLTGRKEGAPSVVYNYETSDILKTQLKKAHKRTSHRPAPGFLGHVVNPGCISFYQLDGKEYAVTEGRWMLTRNRAKWAEKNIKLNNERIEGNQVLILRIPPGSVGRVFNQGVPVLLDVGTHVFNSGTITDVGTRVYGEHQYLRHDRFHYVRVDHGNLARVWAEVSIDGIRSVQPRLLKEGEHFVDSHLFKFSGMSKLSDTYINHGTIHRVSVQKGYVAMVQQDNKPRLLGEGDHVIESTDFVYKGMQSIMSNHCIVHETITIFRVNLGQVALVWQDNEPTFYDEPGLFEFDSPDFTFVEFKSADEQVIQLGSKKTILCQTGQVAVTYDQGELKILPNGRHTINSATHIFHRFLSTQQKSIRLSSLAIAEKNARQSSLKKGYQEMNDNDESFVTQQNSDLTICETKDLVKVGLRADVFYSIDDPEKCIRKIDPDELEDLVRETAVATLTNIIRSTTLNQIAQSKTISAKSVKALEGINVLQPPGGSESDDNPPATAPGKIFFEKVHDEFLSLLNEDFYNRYGVDIANIRIEAFKIMDEELAEQISKHALTTAQIENEMSNLEGTSLISTTRERTAAEVKDISARAEAAALKTKADAENQRNVDDALAKAETLKIAERAKAESEAEKKLTEAKARAEELRLKAEAEKVQDISAKAEATALKTRSDAENQRNIDAALAQAEALRIAAKAQAEADAEVILIKAKAEAEAIRLKAEAESNRAELLSRTTLGEQEALLSLYSNMVVESNRGVEKVVYLDPSVNRDSPFALGSLQNLNMDLHSLTQLGVAASQQNTGGSRNGGNRLN